MLQHTYLLFQQKLGGITQRYKNTQIYPPEKKHTLKLVAFLFIRNTKLLYCLYFSTKRLDYIESALHSTTTVIAFFLRSFERKRRAVFAKTIIIG